MKLTRHSLLTASSLVIGGIIGASALVALADSTWVSAPGTGPTDRANNNVAAPINVGDSTQTKTGLLGLGNLQFQPGGTTVSSGTVMTAIDEKGTVAWRPVAGGSPNNTIYSHGSVLWDMYNSSGQTVFGCLATTTSPQIINGSVQNVVTRTNSATGAAYCSNVVIAGYGNTFGCNNGYQLVNYFKSTDGYKTHQIGYCVDPLNVITQ